MGKEYTFFELCEQGPQARTFGVHRCSLRKDDFSELQSKQHRRNLHEVCWKPNRNEILGLNISKYIPQRSVTAAEPILTPFKGFRTDPPQDMPLWHEDYFGLKAIDTLQA